MGVADNTLVIVTSDNGGDIPTGRDRPECVAQDLGLEINGPLRGDKHTIWEGGLRVPFVVRWPRNVPKGMVSSSMVNLTDVFATVAELVEGKPLNETGVAPDSVSFCQSLLHPNRRSDTGRKEMVITNAQGVFALRQGPWKYIEGRLPASWKRNRKSTYNGQAVRQLYHIVKDPAEESNVIEAHPTVAENMQKLLDRIRQ